MQKLLSCIVATTIIWTASQSPASTLNYFLTVNVDTHEWTLSASTDSPGGIFGIVVNLINYGTGHSVAPRSIFGSASVKGYIVGNLDIPIPELSPPNPANGQAFAAQYPLNLNSLVYQVGYVPVPDDAFGVQPPTFTMLGSAMQVPTVFFEGAYDPSQGIPAFHPKQEVNAGAVFRGLPPPGGYDHPVLADEITYTPEIISYSVFVVPEPAPWILLSIGAAALTFLIRCHTNSLHFAKQNGKKRAKNEMTLPHDT